MSDDAEIIKAYRAILARLEKLTPDQRKRVLGAIAELFGTGA